MRVVLYNQSKSMALLVIVSSVHTETHGDINMEIIKSADYIIDIGPEGGKHGGEILCAGTPEKVAKVKKSYTAKFLKEELENS